MERPSEELKVVRETTLKLLAYCRERHWTGYDPYDALNSRLFRALPFLNFKMARLALTQCVKRSPVNLRPLLRVPKTPNPKGLALFLSSLVKLSKIGLVDEPSLIGDLAARLLSLRSPGCKEICWGYNFDWQTRGELVPRWSPNIICTTFAANALLDAYERSPEPSWLEAGLSSAEYLLNSLFCRKAGNLGSFSYWPKQRSDIHNANLLGAAFLSRARLISGQQKFLGPALKAARYSVSRQHADGSWAYGESSSQRWIDNFHTGYNLVALRRIGEYGGTAEFEPSLGLGLQYYRSHFFREDGAPRYFHDATYPIDIHSVAQSILTLLELEALDEGNLPLAQKVFAWAMANMWDSRGFFYFQKRRAFTLRTPFMRWSQAWMLLALAALLEEGSRVATGASPGPPVPSPERIDT